MAQFDVHRNADAETRELFPYLLDLQHDLLSVLETRVVAPLATASVMGRPLSRLNPSWEIEGATVVLSTQELSGVPRGLLGDVVTSLASDRERVLAALDLLFTGV
jgi:toxin CcdB